MGVPLYTLAAYKGMGDAPRALRKAGVLKALGGVDEVEDVKIPELKEDTVEGPMKNFVHFKEATAGAFAAIRRIDAERSVILGGECSETVGAMAAFARNYGGKAGMLWMDAHGDFNTPSSSPSGYIGGMCLAIACGRAGDLDLGFPPALKEEALVHIGSRALDVPEVEAFNSSPAKLYTAQQVRRTGAADVAEEAARHLENRSDWIACHLDIDVVDPAFIPAVNYPTPNGLSMDEASIIVRSLEKTDKFRVLEVAAYNASKDRGNASARQVATLLKNIFA